MARFIREDGFSIPELLVVLAIGGMVVGAIVGVYQVSQETYTRATSLEDAQLGTRAGLDRIATELRLTGAYWTGATDATDAITAATATSITFVGDVDADTLDSAGTEITLQSAVAAGDTTMTVNATSGFAAGEYVYIADGSVREVRQINAVSGTTITLAKGLGNAYAAGSIVRSVESVTYTFNAGASALTRSVGGAAADTIVDNVTGLTLTYFDVDGNSLGDPPNLSLIREIQISLTAQGRDGSRRTMTSRVRPRNLSLQ